jgi:hypothetical protein
VTVFAIDGEPQDLTRKHHVSGGAVRFASANPIAGRYLGLLEETADLRARGWYALQFASGRFWVARASGEPPASARSGLLLSADVAPPDPGPA